MRQPVWVSSSSCVAAAHTHTRTHALSTGAPRSAILRSRGDVTQHRIRPLIIASRASRHARARRERWRAVILLPVGSMVDAVDVVAVSSSRRHQHSATGIPAQPASVTVPTPAAVAAATGAARMCSLDRRHVRRELQTWAKKMPVVVGTSYRAPLGRQFIVARDLEK